MARNRFFSSVFRMTQVLDEVISSYRSADVKLAVGDQVLERADSSLAGLKKRHSMRGVHPDNEPAGFKNKMGKLKHRVSTRRAFIKASRADIEAALRVFTAERNRLAALASADFITVAGRQGPVQVPIYAGNSRAKAKIMKPANAQKPKVGRSTKSAKTATAAVYVTVRPGQTALGLALKTP